MIIKLPFVTLAAAAVAALSTPAAAQDAPASDFTLSGGAALVSDYRFRGISQTNKRFALQGSIGVAHSSGFYGTIWGSSIDDYVANGSDQEIDLIGGWKTTLGAATLDLGATYYYYPGSGGIDSDFVEPFAAVSHGFGPVTGKLLVAYAPRQSGLSIGNGREDNLYVAGDLSAALPNTPVSLVAHVGRSFGPSYLTIGDEYTDWSLGASVAVKNLSLGVAYVDTDKSLFSPSGRNIAKGGIVASLGVAF